MSALPIQVETNWTADQLFDSDRRHLLHPFAELSRLAKEDSRFFSRAEGVWVHGIDGTPYLDGIGGLWCVNIGYGRREMADAIAEQAAQLPYYNTFTDMSSAPAALLARQIASLAPGDLDRAFFTTGGSTSVDTAVRLAHFHFQMRGRPSKKLVLARENAYHGSTYLAASISGIRRNLAGFHHLADGDGALVRHLSCPNVYRAPTGLSESAYCAALIDELEATIKTLGAENVACFIAEPIMGAAGVLIAPSGYHEQALAVCRRHDILYIADEVVTAFGRLGRMFASQDEFGMVPDMIVCAKGISSGYVPLGAVVFPSRMLEGGADADAGLDTFSHGFTYSGHPVACAAGLKNIEIMEREGLCGHVRATGPHFAAALRPLAALEIVGDARGRGFMHAIEFSRNKETKESFDASVGIGARVAKAAFDRGLVARNVEDMIILSPPLTMTADQIDWLAKTLHAAIEAVMEDLKRERLWPT